jgi:hypothetical protein
MLQDNLVWFPAQLKLKEATFATNKRVYNSEWNVKQATIDVLNKAFHRDTKEEDNLKVIPEYFVLAASG